MDQFTLAKVKAHSARLARRRRPSCERLVAVGPNVKSGKRIKREVPSSRVVVANKQSSKRNKPAAQVEGRSTSVPKALLAEAVVAPQLGQPTLAPVATLDLYIQLDAISTGVSSPIVDRFSTFERIAFSEVGLQDILQSCASVSASTVHDQPLAMADGMLQAPSLAPVNVSSTTSMHQATAASPTVWYVASSPGMWIGDNEDDEIFL